MSKTTKIIAALGVVAGLGVAALPAFSYAASVKGNVVVTADVPSAIAMTIVGNDDTSTHTGVNVYTPDGTSEIGSTYGKSGEGNTPLGTLYNSGSLQASGSKVTILPNAVSADNTFISTIKVWTNASGYTLGIQDAEGTNDLSDGNGHTIPAVDNTETTPGTKDNPIEAGNAAWGYRVAAETPGDWQPVPLASGSATTIKTYSTAGADGDPTVVEYAVSTAADQATGIYTDTITYTATSAN